MCEFFVIDVHGVEMGSDLLVYIERYGQNDWVGICQIFIVFILLVDTSDVIVIECNVL